MLTTLTQDVLPPGGLEVTHTLKVDNFYIFVLVDNLFNVKKKCAETPDIQKDVSLNLTVSLRMLACISSEAGFTGRGDKCSSSFKSDLEAASAPLGCSKCSQSKRMTPEVSRHVPALLLSLSVSLP